MMRRTCLFIAALAAMSCGSGNKDPGERPGTGGATGQQCVSPNCIACITQNCNSEAMTTFGGGYMNNQWNGGQCHNFMGCSNCGHQNETACAQQDGTGCVAALPAFISCVNSPSCSTACGNNPSVGTGGSTSLTTGGTMGTGGIVGTGGSTSLTTGGTMGTGGIVGTGGSTSLTTGGTMGTGGFVGTGGIVVSGGVISTGGSILPLPGAGGSTSSTSAPACPLGTWTTDLGVLCGTTNAYGVSVVTEIVAGLYSVTTTVGPMQNYDPLTGQADSCKMMTSVSLSATYANGMLISTSHFDSDCSKKLVTTTMTINADCTQASLKTDLAGCLSCDVTGTCSGCGSIDCPSSGPNGIAVRSQ